MTSHKGNGVGRIFKIVGSALISLLVLKGWALFSLIGHSGDPSLLAVVVSEGTAVASVSEDPVSGAEENGCPVYVDRLLKNIEQEKDRLKQQELRLEEKDRNLKAYGVEIKDRMQELVRIREEILMMYQKIGENQDKKEMKLVKIYESMEPESAAQRIELMSDELGSQLLIQMKPRSSGQILGIMTSKKASRLTKLLSEKRKKAKRKASSPGSGTKGAMKPKAKAGTSRAQAPQMAPEGKAKSKEARSPAKVAKLTPNSSVLQLGAFRERRSADNLVKNLKDKGYSSFNKPSPNEGYYRVFVGPFENRDQALKIKTKLESKEGFKGLLLKSGREVGV